MQVTMLIFGMQAAFDNTQLVRVIIKVKVEYQGYITQKKAVSGALMFHKHIFFFMLAKSGTD